MGTLNQHRTLIKKILSDYAQAANKAPDGVETHLVFDEDRDHYMAFRTGWWGKKRIHSAVIYVRLHNGKIWIEEDWTEEGIATDLLAAGVAKTDIILAFHHPTMPVKAHAGIASISSPAPPPLWSPAASPPC